MTSGGSDGREDVCSSLPSPVGRLTVHTSGEPLSTGAHTIRRGSTPLTFDRSTATRGRGIGDASPARGRVVGAGREEEEEEGSGAVVGRGREEEREEGGGGNEEGGDTDVSGWEGGGTHRFASTPCSSRAGSDHMSALAGKAGAEASEGIGRSADWTPDTLDGTTLTLLSDGVLALVATATGTESTPTVTSTGWTPSTDWAVFVVSTEGSTSDTA